MLFDFLSLSIEIENGWTILLLPLGCGRGQADGSSWQRGLALGFVPSNDPGGEEEGGEG